MISYSDKLSHEAGYRAEDYSYLPIPNKKHSYGKATLNFFKPVELTEELLLTPDIALCMATFYGNTKVSKSGNKYKAFSRNDLNVKSIDSWMCLDLDNGISSTLLKKLESYTYYLTTTQNHMNPILPEKEQKRYKLFIKTNLVFKDDTLKYYKAAYKEVANQLDITNYDKHCTDLSRLIAPLALEGESTTIVSKGTGSEDFTHIDLTSLPATLSTGTTLTITPRSLPISTSATARVTLNKGATTAFISQGMYPDDNGNLHHTLEFIMNPSLRPQEPRELAESRATIANPLLAKELQKLTASTIERRQAISTLQAEDTLTASQKAKLTKVLKQEATYTALKEEFILATDAETLLAGEKAFQPLEIVEEGNHLVARAQGQHDRNKHCSLVMNIDVKMTSEIKPHHQEVFTTEKHTYYYDSKKMYLVTEAKQDLRFFPADLYSPSAVIDSFADLYRVGDDMYMLQQTKELIMAQELLRILEVQYGDIFIHGFTEDGQPIPASPAKYSPSVLKFINEELPADRRVNGVREIHTYLPSKEYVDEENFYVIQKPLTKPTTPKIEVEDTAYQVLEARLREKFPDLEASIRMAVLGGFMAEGKYSKTFISLLNAESDSGKGVLLTKALTNLGLVKRITRNAFVDTFMENGPGGTDPKSIENTLIVIINEANSSASAEEKMMDALKDAHEYGIDGRTLHSRNVQMRLNQVWLVSAQTLSFSNSPHYEHATRMTKFRWNDDVLLENTQLMQGFDLDTEVRPALERLIYNIWLDEYTECRTLSRLDINKRASIIGYNAEARNAFLKSSKAVEIRTIIEMAGLALSHHSTKEIASLIKLDRTAPNQQRDFYRVPHNTFTEEDNTKALLLTADFRIAFKNRSALGEYLDNGGDIGKNTAKNIIEKMRAISQNFKSRTFGGHQLKCIGLLSLDRDTFLDPHATDKIRTVYPDIADAYAAYDDNLESITPEQWTKLVKYYMEESEKNITQTIESKGGLDV